MTKKEKIKFILKKLDELYPEVRKPLNHVDPYTLLIAVVLSAQCTDKRVNQVTPILFKKADTPAKMVKLTIDEIKGIIKPCGLYKNKSKAIYNLSKIILNKHNGKVPDTFEDLEALPGVGHKTASVVMIQAFGKPAFPVDTHIHRIMCRWGLSSGKNVEQTEKDCKRLFPKKTWYNLHLQIIYFGKEHCQARGHKIDNCPICSKLSKIN
ncbi:MAG: endonuclease III [Bacteroidota bacterium]